MLSKSLVVLALTAVAFATAPFSNSTGPFPAHVRGWKYVGCASLPHNGTAAGQLVLADTSKSQTVEKCTIECAGYAFAGLSGDGCYCSNDITTGTTFQPDSACSSRCSGAPVEACGRAGILSHRQLNPASLLSLYEQIIIPVGIVYVSISIAVYIDIDIHGLTTCTFSAPVTVTACGCEHQQIPHIPMTTKVVPCTVCEGKPTVTLTVPCNLPTTTRTVIPIIPTGGVVVPVSPAGHGGPAATNSVFVGGANSNGASAGIAGLLVGALALL